VPDRSRRVGILGGTFDPIHNGHLDVGDAAMRALRLDRLYVVTAHVPPHRRQPHASPFHRFAMVALAINGRASWEASDIELESPETSYTSDTLRKFHARGFAPHELFFILGADAFADIASWRHYPHLLSEANFVVVSRPGLPADALPTRLPDLAPRMIRAPFDTRTPSDPAIILIEAATPDVSSTAIRERCAHGASLAGFVPAAVEQHIVRNGLYVSAAPQPSVADGHGSPQADRLHGQKD